MTAVALISDGRVAGVLQDLARRDAHPVVRRRDVDQVRRVHVQRHARRLQRLGVLARFGLLPALRVAEEELHHVGAVGLRRGQGIVLVDVRTNKHAASLGARPDSASKRRCYWPVNEPCMPAWYLQSKWVRARCGRRCERRYAATARISGRRTDWPRRRSRCGPRRRCCESVICSPGLTDGGTAKAKSVDHDLGPNGLRGGRGGALRVRALGNRRLPIFVDRRRRIIAAAAASQHADGK